MRFHRTLSAMAATAAVLTSVAGLAGTVQAKGPITGPPLPAEGSFDVPAGEACEFATRVELAGGKAGAIFFDDGRAHFYSPGLTLRLTNVKSGKSVLINSTGSFHDQPGIEAPGGLVFDTKMVGHNLLFGPFVGDNGVTTNGMYSYTGKATLTITFDGKLNTFSNIDDSTAQVTDMCAVLAS